MISSSLFISCVVSNFKEGESPAVTKLLLSISGLGLDDGAKGAAEGFILTLRAIATTVGRS